MTTAPAASIETKLFALRARFLSRLPERIDALAAALASEEHPRDLQRRFHSLAGTAGTYGLLTVSELAAEGEDLCERTTAYDDATVAYFRFLIDAIRDAARCDDSANSRVALSAVRDTHVIPEVARVLGVEDDADQAAYTAAILRDAGYDALFVADAANFHRMLPQFAPDLILMDMGLPGITGVDLAREVRENAAYTTVPIVILTAEQHLGARIEAIGVGADDYLTKPVAPDLLCATISARLKRSQSVQALIDHDQLTGALTRGGFFRRVELATAEARRRREPLALVMLDLDHFKSVNDSYGHITGDRVLTAFVAYLMRNLRESDEIGRYGGEEFVLLLRDINAAAAQTLVSRLIREFSSIQQRATDGTKFSITFSAGVAMWEPNCDLQTWKQRADEALYAAKNRGRARVEAA